MAERVNAYLDGFNLYFGMRDKRWKSLYWLDVGTLAQELLKPHQVLGATKYFTARISGPNSKQVRQATYLLALEAVGRCKIIYGRYQSSPMKCRYCGGGWEQSQEKMTDVNIAVEMLSDAVEDVFDTALLVSGDADLVPAVETIRRLFPAKRIVAAFPPERVSQALRKEVHAHFVIGRLNLARSQLPESVARANGTTLTRPAKWR
jgi:uncharacterized LabA/DUF88 family protein